MPGLATGLILVELAVGRKRGPRLAAVSFAVVIGLLVGYLVTGGHIGAGGPGSRPINTEKGSSIGAEPSYIRRVTSLPESVYTKVGYVLGDLQLP